MVERRPYTYNEGRLTDPPSIGSREISFDRTGNRIRQIVEGVVDRVDILRDVLRDAEQFAGINNSTRTIVRALTRNRLLGRGLLRTIRENGFNVEAAIPLSGKFEGTSFYYYGRNAQDRYSSEEIIEQESILLRRVFERGAKTPLEIFERCEDFNLEKLTGRLSEEDSVRLAEMYKASFTDYPFDIIKNIRLMTEDNAYVVYAARSKSDNMLYSVCITEQMALNVPGFGAFIMREMGDSAKMPNVNGLNAPLKLMLIKKAFEDGIDLVFCESRAALGAVNAVNHDIGMEYCGFLPQHTKIGGEGINEGSPYGNMNVWALNKDTIQRIGQEVKLLTK